MGPRFSNCVLAMAAAVGLCQAGAACAQYEPPSHSYRSLESQLAEGLLVRGTAVHVAAHPEHDNPKGMSNIVPMRKWMIVTLDVQETIPCQKIKRLQVPVVRDKSAREFDGWVKEKNELLWIVKRGPASDSQGAQFIAAHKLEWHEAMPPISMEPSCRKLSSPDHT